MADYIQYKDQYFRSSTVSQHSLQRRDIGHQFAQLLFEIANEYMARKKPQPCRTCKSLGKETVYRLCLLILRRVRKVKCDQGWPACDRCIPTGRVCDGHGIWGGGGNAYCDCKTCLKTLTRSIPLRHLIPASVGVPNITQEEGYLE